MQHDVFQLYEMNIHVLRNLAREVGVKAPTSLKKKALIDKIIQIESGNQQPCMPTKKGRPSKNDAANEKIVDENAIGLEKNIKKSLLLVF